MHPPIKKSVCNIYDIDKWCKIIHGDPMVDGKDTFLGNNMFIYYQKDGFIPSKNIQHYSQHNTGLYYHYQYHLQYYYQNNHIRGNIIWVVSSRFSPHIHGYTLTLIWIVRGTLLRTGIYQNIMTIGKWSSNSLLLYISRQVREISKWSIVIMVQNRSLYTIPEDKSVYYDLCT